MSNTGYTGYLFATARGDLNSKDSLDKSRILVVARSVEKAMTAAATLASQQSLDLIEVGADVLAEARMAAVEDDRAKLA